MPPQDPTPLGDEMVERLPDRKFPQPKPARERPGVSSEESAKAQDISRRPALPDHPERMAADIEDEDADPVIDTGPGIADGPNSGKARKA
jgi:hypothetical protein